MAVRFADRAAAGRRLAAELQPARSPDLVVFALPRGGVPVAVEVARALGAPLDVIVVRKLGAPFQPELAMGAIGETGARIIDAEVVAVTGVTEAALRKVEDVERDVVRARAARLRHGRQRIDVGGRTALIVDDGMATGSSARAACRIARQWGAARVIVGVPVAPAATVRTFTDADAVVAVYLPPRFTAVGSYYRDFRETSDDEVIRLLDEADAAGRERPAGA